MSSRGRNKNGTRAESNQLKSKKLRLDRLVVERGLAENEKEAQSLIIAGSVLSGTRKLQKPGEAFAADIPLELKAKKDHPWVSRGGVKLAHGLEFFNISPAGMVAIDVGASTGGFTDVLLHNGAKKIYAVDVGYGELAWKLQQDERVIVLDRTNARYISQNEIPEMVDIIVCDASFISLKTVLPAALALAKPGGILVALIKPQFELGKHEIGEGGIVEDPVLHKKTCNKIKQWLEESLSGWRVLGVTESPIKGREGNREFLIGACFDG